jgi:osmotically-inducible protein OsmY
MAMFGTDCRDPSRYDLVLNMSTMRREGAKRIVVEAAKLEEYQPTPESNQAFNDLSVGSRVQAALFALPDLRGSGLEVRATEGHVHIGGRIEQGSAEELVRIVKIIRGVTDVTTEVHVVPPQAFLEP